MAQEKTGARVVLGTDRGDVGMVVFSPGMASGDVRAVLPTPTRLKLSAVPGVHFVDTGVPHAVVFVESLDALSRMDVAATAVAVRASLPEDMSSTNVNFVAVVSAAAGKLQVRTFERGVEAETLACGTGSAAVAVVARAAGKISLTSDAVEVAVAGGVSIVVLFSCVDEKDVVSIQGPATVVFRGHINPADLGLSF